MNETNVAYQTAGGIAVTRRAAPGERRLADAIIERLDGERGAYFASHFEYPGRYARWEIGFVAPPLAITVRGTRFAIEALNARGTVLLPAITRALKANTELAVEHEDEAALGGTVLVSKTEGREEDRTRRPSAFSLLRTLIALFQSPADDRLGLYGAFGYDVAFQFDPIRQRLPRAPEQRDLVLYLPDQIIVLDHRRESAVLYDYDFAVDGQSTEGLPRAPSPTRFSDRHAGPGIDDHPEGSYQDTVKRAREAFARGDLFEVVCSQLMVRPASRKPATLYRRLTVQNPAPYHALINLGEGEHLVSASPEMFVRVRGRAVETCPISGTIRRGRNALSDADQILALLNSTKDAAELTMCTDVDRNDKARVSVPGSVKVIGRRNIEMYSRLIHTCDHVVGELRTGMDALDAFLSHAWAVTVTGAPKRWAMQFIEDHERSPRRWYGGAFGWFGFDGGAETGLTLRTARLAAGTAEVRVGATLLFDSDPDAEQAECVLKASALLGAIAEESKPALKGQSTTVAGRAGASKRVLFVDHEDSFVHMLADYVRQSGAEVDTFRPQAARTVLGQGYDLVLLSPGPGTPADFGVAETIAACLAHNLPIFGVCLGLQGITEYFGGRLGQIEPPMHGKPSLISVSGGRIFRGLPSRFRAGRYHSLHAKTVPADLLVTATAEDGIVMALEHRTLPIVAVQFHPESILTVDEDVGLRLIGNVLQVLCGPPGDATRARPGIETARR